MKRITKWIQERKAYSNPVFGAMLIVSATIFPVFQASARIAEPVQPMALNADQVVDALDAVQVGIPTDLAFGIQPVPYRDWGKYQKQYIERLFGDPYVIEDSALLMFEDIDETSVGSILVGQTSGGQLFDMEVLGAYRADITDTDYFTPSQTQIYLDANLDLFAIIASIETDLGKINFAGMAWQFTRPTGERISEIVILNEMQQIDYDEFYPGPQYSQSDIPPYVPRNCDEAFQLADNTFNTARQIAKNNMAACILAATLTFAVTISGCATASLLPGVGFLITALCSLGALGVQAAGYGYCLIDFTAALANARATRAGSRAAARAMFGDDCAPDPV